ncbi:carboxypeptidase N subunit 2-like [Gigantopelta aegis]|uniref:carboxypeptidase N subunit 2-like n=1 Tax=Gigantopelta aegis TaxID=1735272 RepID=UPI001B88C186|nr:carboxypeptidase N subunit 2-like [Gigantopelta aegis]
MSPVTPLLLMMTLSLTVTQILSELCPPGCTCSIDGWRRTANCRGGSLSSILNSLTPEFTSVIIKITANARNLQPSHFQPISHIPLTQLAIDESWVNRVESGTFETLTRLQELSLRHNMLSTVSPDVFLGLSNLKKLNLSNNRIRSIENMLDSLYSLEHLDLSYNQLDDLRTGVFRSQLHLVSLRLDGNSLHNLHGYVFQGLQNLKYLSLRKCNLMVITSDMFSIVRSITTLDLGQNHITELPRSQEFRNLPSLQNLFLDNNELTTFKDAQFSGITLDTLNVSRNRITSLSSETFIHFNVREIDLSYNALSRLQDSFLRPTAPQLEHLNLAGNPLRHIRKLAFEGLYRLKLLNLSSCTLETLDENMFSSLQNMKTLDLSWNSLQYVPDKIVSVFNKLESLQLSQNYWKCDCRIKSLRSWLQGDKSLFIMACLPQDLLTEQCSKPKCSMPTQLTNTPIAMVKEKNVLECDPASEDKHLPVGIQVAIVIPCLIVGVCLLVLTVFLWRRGRTKQHLEKGCLKPMTESSHFDVDRKIKPFMDSDIRSLAESDKSYVFKNYFQTMRNLPDKPLTPSQIIPSVTSQRDIDSVYSSQPSLYSASSITAPIHVHIARESTV